VRNFWLDRRPKIHMNSNPYDSDSYGKWYICKPDGEMMTIYGPSPKFIYLHKDGSWRSSTYDPVRGKYSGFYNSEREAEEILQKYT